MPPIAKGNGPRWPSSTGKGRFDYIDIELAKAHSVRKQRPSRPAYPFRKQPSRPLLQKKGAVDYGRPERQRAFPAAQGKSISTTIAGACPGGGPANHPRADRRRATDVIGPVEKEERGPTGPERSPAYISPAGPLPGGLMPNNPKPGGISRRGRRPGTRGKPARSHWRAAEYAPEGLSLNRGAHQRHWPRWRRNSRGDLASFTASGNIQSTTPPRG